MPQLDRRDFLRLVGGTAGAAAASGCSEVSERLIPYVVQPEEVTPGIATWYASTCTECSAGCGLLVKTREGRPIKLEGNPEHPVNRGALCARGQVAHGRTYHPDRYRGPMKRGAQGLEPATWDEARAAVAAKIRENPGGVQVLGGPVGPTLHGLIDQWVAAVGAGGRLVYEPFSQVALRAATEAVFGRAALPLLDIAGADLILDFDSDFLDTGSSPVEHARQFAEARDVAKHPDGGARLVSVGPRMTLTTSNAEEWLPAAAGSEGAVALLLAKAAFERLQSEGGAVPGDAAAIERVLRGVDTASVAERAGVEPARLDALVERLLAAEAPVAFPPRATSGTRRATADAAAVLLLNALTGAVGPRVRIPEADARPAAASMAEVNRLVEAMNAGQVSVLVVHGANPVYSLPPDTGFREALGKVGLVVSTASLRDETSELAHWVLPDHTGMESWGDSRPRAGVRSLVQPTVRPLYDTQALGDTFLDVGRALGEAVAAKLPDGSFRQVLERAWADTDFRKAKGRGGVFGAEASAAGDQPAVQASVARLEFKEPQLEGDGDYALVAYPHPLLGDGGGAAQGWLQEIPDTVTKLAWQSWAEISEATAARLGVGHGDVIAVETDFGRRRIELPVAPRRGIRDDVVAVAIGQGHTVGHYASLEGDGQPGVARGVNVVEVLPTLPDESGGRAWLAANAKLSKTGRYQRLPQVQNSDNQRGRGLAQTRALGALGHGGAAAGHAAAFAADEGHGDGHGGGHAIQPFDPANDAEPESPYRWGMAVDLDRCTGCSACVAACYTENNLPVVGESEVLRFRHMAWINIHRYVGDGVDEGGADRRLHLHMERYGETDVRNQPLLCQQCGAAPCEPVCPVFATYHSPEGLNGMIYNRCVGTRYCANNCSYKVRRFNYFDYSQERWPGDLYLMLNPDVTARQQGVMEKCTFCVQRIAEARQTAKDEGRPIADGEVRTACQQACPTQAITFGNLRDADSAVSKKSDDEERGYYALHVLNTRPAVRYLAKVDREKGEA